MSTINEYKKCSNLILTLLKRRKKYNFTKFHQENCKDLKNLWKGIKNI